MKFSELDNTKAALSLVYTKDSDAILDDYKEIIEGIRVKLSEQPGVTDLHAVQTYLTELRFELLLRWGDIQKRFVMHQSNFIRTSSDDFYKRLKNSSTLIEAAAMSTFPYSEEYYIIKDLLRLLQQVSPEYNTIVSAMKLEKV
jgi:hypothetical protein